MASGLPVIASRSGGMAEMLTDGRSGWLASACDADALAAELRRALDTSPEGPVHACIHGPLAGVAEVLSFAP